MHNATNKLTVTGTGDGDNISMAGGNYRILISGAQTGGTFAVIEMLVPPGGGPGPHAHADFQESFYVVDGEVEVKTEDVSYIATKGAFVSIPLGGMVHCFKNQSDKIANLLCTVVPAGLDDFFKEAGQPVAAGEFLKPKPMDDDTKKKMAQLAEKYGQKIYPPDYLDK